MNLITVLDIIFSATISFSLLYTLINAVITRKEVLKLRAVKIPEKPGKGISILKPLKGIDDDIDLNLRSFFEQDYDDFEILFGVEDPDDPVIDVVKYLIHNYPDKSSKLIIGKSLSGLNPKINNLQNVFAHASKEYILISDSNTRIEKNYLSMIIKEMDDRKTGLVLSVLRGIKAKNWISKMENLHLNTYVTPNIYTIRSVFHRTIAIGKSMLIPRKIIDRLGGFQVFSEYLAEDYMISKKIEKLGYKVTIAKTFVDTVNRHWSMRQFFNRHTRWGKMRCNINTLDYFIETLSNPIAISAVYALVTLNAKSLLVFALVTVYKTLYDMYITRLLDTPLKFFDYFLTPLKDIITGSIWYIPLFSKKINWRGNFFYIGKDTIITRSWRTT